MIKIETIDRFSRNQIGKIYPQPRVDMPLPDRKSHRRSVALNGIGKFSIVITTILVAFHLFIWWFFRGAAFRPEEVDRGMAVMIFGIMSLCAVTVALAGIKTIDREDR
jgi:hypothetical protein